MDSRNVCNKDTVIKEIEKILCTFEHSYLIQEVLIFAQKLRDKEIKDNNKK